MGCSSTPCGAVHGGPAEHVGPAWIDLDGYAPSCYCGRPYSALSLTDPALAIAPLVRNSAAVIDVVAAQLRAAKAAAGSRPT